VIDRATPREGVKAEMEVAQMPMAAATIADENLMVVIALLLSSVSVEWTMGSDELQCNRGRRKLPSNVLQWMDQKSSVRGEVRVGTFEPLKRIFTCFSTFYLPALSIESFTKIKDPHHDGRN